MQTEHWNGIKTSLIADTIVVGYYGFTLVVHVSVRPSIHPSVCPSVFSFPDDNLSKYQWIFAKLGMYIDIVEI